MRTFSSACAVSVAAAVTLLSAPTAFATPPGDNGTVKIHDASTSEELRKNEPHVCTFYLDAFGFDGGQQVTWKIVEMPPTGTKGVEAKTGLLELNLDGHGRTAELSLPDGHYKLIWNFDGEHGRAKHKVFWTSCEKDADTPAEQSDSPADTPQADTPQAEESAPAATSPDGGKGDLAETGAGSVAGISVAAALLLGAGGAMAFRRRAHSRG
ncbi:hypothetical protein [Streptomyces meridianus]|uniref:LPXTG cell wall anchor domain-containing protein n=1 Tax=Streptomyces meridianus TaxID=2938945 RepID=A0ABT0X9Q4_9ACTN|nr:hypothetical protein [Streptomyces meridianus]MCM2579134.1 hypothetical protein [Streptomyces meridianus]